MDGSRADERRQPAHEEHEHRHHDGHPHGSSGAGPADGLIRPTDARIVTGHRAIVFGGCRKCGPTAAAPMDYPRTGSCPGGAPVASSTACRRAARAWATSARADGTAPRRSTKEWTLPAASRKTVGTPADTRPAA